MNTNISLLRKFLRANDERKSRLHDRKGTIVPLDRAIINGGKALASYLMLKIFDMRPTRPWISYAATKKIDAFMSSRRCKVLEFGSGMSTLWFVQRAERVCSVEHDPSWYAVLSAKLNVAGDASSKVEYQLESEKLNYANFKSTANAHFDVLLVDGPWRAECLKNHLHLINKGGLIYLDNTDAESSSGDAGELDQAVGLLLDFARDHDAKVTWFTDFSPTCLFVTQGLMVEMPVS